MGDGLDKLSDATGLSREAMNNIWREVKANQKRLDACPGPHDFEPDPTEDDHKVLRHHVCRKCGGRVSGINAHWYNQGLAHARRERRDG